MRLLLRLTLLMASATAAAADSQECVDRYAALARHTPAPPTSALPHIYLPGSPEESTKVFQLSLASWDKSFSADQLKRRLIRLQDDPFSGGDFLDGLATIARQASFLRSTQEALGQNHAAPKAFYDFTNALNELNATIARKASRADIAAAAAKTEKSLNALTSDQEYRLLLPAEISNVRKRVRVNRERLQSLLDVEHPPTIEKLGRAKATVRELLSLSRAEHALHPSAETDAAYSFLYKLNEDLGKMHDNFLRQAQEGEVDYKRQAFFVHPLLRDQISQLERAMGNSLNSSGALPK